MNYYYHNQYLFSEIYLKEITDFPEKPEITSTLNTLKEYKDYADTDSLTEWKSTFIQKVFGVLGFGYSSVDDNIIKLFRPGETDKPISVCYALLPNENLDNDTIGSHWSEKIIRNLKANDLSWGLLTNGNVWRIYHVDEPSPYETYLQIDLSEILEKDDTKNYMIFFEFMKADNFIKDEDGKCKFDQFKEESFEKIEYIEEELKDALKQREGESGKGVLNDICMGYIEYLRSKGETDFSNEDFRKEIYSGAMLYMFRLLFIFYATARELLTQEEIDSFRDILKKSKTLFNTPNAKRDINNLWEELRELFAIIEVHYNGGLFDPEEHKFIENTRISDHFLTRVLYNMNFYKDDYGNEQPISYRDMGVRHLGTLYEGLLEHKLYVAEEDTQVKIEKGAVKFIPKSQGGAIVEGNYIPKGEVYFAGDKGERKSTGSYYTPEYIVDYIVTNTVGEKLTELKDEFAKENESLFDDISSAVDKTEKSRFTSYLEEQLLSYTKKKILKLSVLDPAMGSGHFLVNATNQIANFITEFLNEYGLSTEQTSSTVYWRRRVVENCIYGVDINPLAVELAKLSLWILSMAKDAHLSFLNHHLKCGNSLIGARLSDIGIYPGNEKKTKKGELSLWDKDENFKQTVEKVISDYFAIEERETFDKNDIEFKKELLDDINEDLNLYKKVCDFHTDVYFDETIDESYYFSKLKSPQIIEVENNSYFHWALEFPEIFRAFNRFDCVIGNPPYINIKSGINISLKNYYKEIYDLAIGQFDLFCLFIEKAVELSNSNSLIVPKPIINNENYELVRKLLLENNLKRIIIGSDVFENAGVESCIYICDKNYSSKEVGISQIIGEKFIFNWNIAIDTISMLPYHMINTELNPGNLNLITKIQDNSLPLGDLLSIIRGVESGKKDTAITKNITNYKLLRGEDVLAYSINYKHYYINYDENNLAKYKHISLYENEKILIRRVGSDLIATYDDSDFLTLNTLYNCKLINNKVSLLYLLALLNSSVIKYWFKMVFVLTDKLFPYVRVSQLNNIPIRISSKYSDLVESKVKIILQTRSNNPQANIEPLLSELDMIVFDIYEIEKEEADLINKKILV